MSRRNPFLPSGGATAEKSEDSFLNQTVAEFLFGPCSEGVLMEKAADSEYWAKCEEFVDENDSKPLSELTYKQRDWLIKIKEGLLE